MKSWQVSTGTFNSKNGGPLDRSHVEKSRGFQVTSIDVYRDVQVVASTLISHLLWAILTDIEIKGNI